MSTQHQQKLKVGFYLHNLCGKTEPDKCNHITVKMMVPFKQQGLWILLEDTEARRWEYLGTWYGREDTIVNS